MVFEVLTITHLRLFVCCLSQRVTSGLRKINIRGLPSEDPRNSELKSTRRQRRFLPRKHVVATIVSQSSPGDSPFLAIGTVLAQGHTGTMRTLRTIHISVFLRGGISHCIGPLYAVPIYLLRCAFICNPTRRQNGI